MIRYSMALSTLIMGIFLIGISPGYAETFTLGQVYSLGLQENEDVQIAREGILQAEEEKKRVRSAILPKLTLTGTYNRFPEEQIDLGDSRVFLQPEYSYGAELKLEQPLFSGGKSRAAIRIAGQEIELARKDLHLSGEALLARVAQVYYGMLKAQKNLEAQNRNVERLQEHRRLSELRFKVGEVTEAILLRAEAELAGSQAEQVARANDLEVIRRELQILADLPDGFEIEEPPVPEVPGGMAGPLTEVARAAREDLKQSRIQEEIAADRIRFARAHFSPSLTLEGTYFSRNQDPRSTFFIDRSWVAGAKMEFPLYDGGLRRADLAQARSRQAEDRLKTARLIKRIDLDLKRSELTLEAVTRAMESREQQLRFATKNYEMISRQFTFGVATNIELLDANQILIEAERDVIGARVDRHLAILGLQQSAGIFLDEAMEQAGARL